MTSDRDAAISSFPIAAIEDHAIGAVLGLAVGDAVGVTLEFAPRDSFTPIDDMIGGGLFQLTPGYWSDDTSLARAESPSGAEH